MSKKGDPLVAAVKRKREELDMSIRKLASDINVSFSTLARLERGEGEPDNNTKIRLLEWLGNDAEKFGMPFERALFVHFRARKNASSNTIDALFDAAVCLKQDREIESDEPEFEPEDYSALSKGQMENLAERFRSDLGINPDDPLDSLRVSIDNVAIETVSNSSCLQERTRRKLMGQLCDEWSAMSVPLDAIQDHWVVLLNDCHVRERQRVTILEEYWHILLGHRLTKVAKFGNIYGRTYDSAEEHDAYYLASACLLPKTAFTSAVESGRSSDEIASQFGTSRELVDYRKKRLGLWSATLRKSYQLAD